MATRKGLVQIKDLIKNGVLSSARKYTSAFVNSLGVYGRLELTVEGRVSRKTILKEIFDDLKTR